jgi:hypothetical protein
MEIRHLPYFFCRLLLPHLQQSSGIDFGVKKQNRLFLLRPFQAGLPRANELSRKGLFFNHNIA